MKLPAYYRTSTAVYRFSTLDTATIIYTENRHSVEMMITKKKLTHYDKAQILSNGHQIPYDEFRKELITAFQTAIDNINSDPTILESIPANLF